MLVMEHRQKSVAVPSPGGMCSQQVETASNSSRQFTYTLICSHKVSKLFSKQSLSVNDKA